MAALALTVPAATSASSFCGQKVSVKPTRVAAQRSSVRLAAPRAKYGDESVYFDLKDPDNTTGNWDLYGSDAATPYNSLQSKFFETFGGLFTKRGVLLKVLVLGGSATLGHFAITSGQDFLPIKKGPQLAPTSGPRGRK